MRKPRPPDESWKPITPVDTIPIKDFLPHSYQLKQVQNRLRPRTHDARRQRQDKCASFDETTPQCSRFATLTDSECADEEECLDLLRKRRVGKLPTNVPPKTLTQMHPLTSSEKTPHHPVLEQTQGTNLLFFFNYLTESLLLRSKSLLGEIY